MSRNRIIVAALALVGLGLLVFVVAQTWPRLATLGSAVIREVDFQSYLERTYPSERVVEIRRSPAERQSALEAFFDNVAIVAKARQSGVDREKHFQTALALMEMKTLAQLFTERHRERLVLQSTVTPDEISTYYEQHKHEYSTEPHFTAHQLLVYVRGNPAFPEQGLVAGAAKAKAQRALAELRAGKSWETVARAYSDEVATSQRGGLIRDGQFGYYAKEVEQAIRTQKLNEPGELVASGFGYHVLEVVERITVRLPQPFERVKDILTDRLSEKRSSDAREAFMLPLQQEIGFTTTDAGKRDGFLLDTDAVPSDALLAEVGGKKIFESDFRWFWQDALLPSQRASSASRPGARQGLLRSYLDQLVLAAKARKDGLDRTSDFARRRVAFEEQLLSEFMLEHDKASPAFLHGQSDQDRLQTQRRYFDRLRAEVGLEIVSSELKSM